MENEHLDLIGEGDGDGWVRARNYKGEEGYVPQNYVEIETSSSPAGFPLQPQISFSSVDYHVQEANAAAADQKESESMNGYPEPALETDDYLNQNLPEEPPTTTAPTTVSSGLTTPFINDYRGEGNNSVVYQVNFRVCRMLINLSFKKLWSRRFILPRTVRL